MSTMTDKCASAVYFDGSCPLCRAEIAHYKGQVGADAISFVDVSKPDADLPTGLTREQAMARFHVRDDKGELVSGARAFVSVWRALPRWGWAARLASLPGVTPVLELGYRLFLPVRPLLSRLAGRLARKRKAEDR
jgi:predicted DCC family thiol-disulfide oxidoreductase YuxK